MADDAKAAVQFFTRVRNLDLEKLRRELSRLSTINFRDPFQPRAPYAPSYCIGAQSANACVKALVEEFTTWADTYNRYNKDAALMSAVLETPSLKERQKVINASRAELIYQAGQVLAEYKIELARFLRDRGLMQEYGQVDRMERSAACRVMLAGKEWWTTY
jgi:hypothetical protein